LIIIIRRWADRGKGEEIPKANEKKITIENQKTEIKQRKRYKGNYPKSEV